MDESDFSIFGSSKKSSKSSKHDKADATCNNASGTPYSRELSIHAVDPSKKVIISRPTEDDEYNCDNPNAGIALIFNHKDVKGQKQRAGTEKDRDAMEATLRNYGFDVRVYDDLTFAEVSEKLKAGMINFKFEKKEMLQLCTIQSCRKLCAQKVNVSEVKIICGSSAIGICSHQNLNYEYE